VSAYGVQHVRSRSCAHDCNGSGPASQGIRSDCRVRGRPYDPPLP
jgi:hypothetical protein